MFYSHMITQGFRPIFLGDWFLIHLLYVCINISKRWEVGSTYSMHYQWNWVLHLLQKCNLLRVGLTVYLMKEPVWSWKLLYWNVYVNPKVSFSSKRLLYHTKARVSHTVRGVGIIRRDWVTSLRCSAPLLATCLVSWTVLKHFPNSLIPMKLT